MLDRKALSHSLSLITARIPQIMKVARCIPIALLAIGALGTAAQSKPLSPVPGTVPVLMLSDLHFDPFHDPDRIPLLAKEPISKWKSILEMPDSPNQATRFAALQQTCKAKESTDTPYTLLRSTLDAAKGQTPAVGFVTLSGDLLVHDLDCKYRVAMSLPESTADDQSVSTAFAEKTTSFVIEQVDAAFQKVPVYVALGNNDSRCNHNRLDLHDGYLQSSAPAIIAGLRGADAAEITLARRTYESAGYYAVTMPAPMRNTRLIVLNDIYMMPKFTSCEANEDRKGEQEQIEWLQKQLDAARLRKQRVWVLGHLPPSINADASLSAKGSFCSGGRAVRFQDTEDLANQMAANADTITLGIFGHTHMDEFHVLTGTSDAVPIKVVASVSPVDGNLPSFTIGVVDLHSATLTDYNVYEASNRTGLTTRWSQEYNFNNAYHEQGFSPVSLRDLISRLRADQAGVGVESLAYQNHLLKGANRKKLSRSWPGYVCGLDNSTSDGFKACVCSTP